MANSVARGSIWGATKQLVDIITYKYAKCIAFANNVHGLLYPVNYNHISHAISNLLLFSFTCI